MLQLGKILATVALAAFALDASASERREDLNVGVWNLPDDYNPATMSGNWNALVMRNLYEGLLSLDSHGKPIPGQAESWDISADAKTYTFYIRDDAFWSDGTPVTARDFETTWKTAFDPQTKDTQTPPLLNMLENADAVRSGDKPLSALGVNALDEKTLQLKLSFPANYLLPTVAHISTMAAPSKISNTKQKYESWGNPDGLLFNGPYKVSKYEAGKVLELAKNEHYYGASGVEINTLRYKFYPDEQDRLIQAYLQEEIDVTYIYGPTIDYTLQNKNLQSAVFDEGQGSIYYYTFNNSHPKFKNKDIRKALAYALNEKVIVDKIYKLSSAADTIVPSTMYRYPSDLDTMSWRDLPYSERIAQARALMQQNGYSKENPLKVKLSYNNLQTNERVANAVRSHWATIFVETEFVAQPSKAHFKGLLDGHYEIGRVGWHADYNDPQNLLNLFRSNSGANYSLWENATFDQLYDAYVRSNSPTDATQALKNALLLLDEELPAIPILFSKRFTLVRPSLNGYNVSFSREHPVRWFSWSSDEFASSE